ncbi:hypothetical protein MKEN_00186200 [Mycena kentingensis (nom. inval.)]|nr:hypothetical protein MKEN_00186200 [Mycena kentingensis (nom. inval.)]
MARTMQAARRSIDSRGQPITEFKSTRKKKKATGPCAMSTRAQTKISAFVGGKLHLYAMSNDVLHEATRVSPFPFPSSSSARNAAKFDYAALLRLIRENPSSNDLKAGKVEITLPPTELEAGCEVFRVGGGGTLSLSDPLQVNPGNDIQIEISSIQMTSRLVYSDSENALLGVPADASVPRSPGFAGSLSLKLPQADSAELELESVGYFLMNTRPVYGESGDAVYRGVVRFAQFSEVGDPSAMHHNEFGFWAVRPVEVV